MALAHRLGRRLAAQDGFTLIELVVAMAVGTVVVIGAMSIMVSTMYQSKRTFTEVDATRAARTAMATLENELHSGCVDGPIAAPVQGITNGAVESDANDLVFLSFTGTSANPTPVWHDLVFNATAKTLVDNAYTAAGVSPNWTQGSTLLSTNTLLTNVTAQGTTPVFQYFSYEQEYTDAQGNTYWIVPDGTNQVPFTGATPDTPLSTTAGLSANDSNNTVEVVINLLVGPPGSSLDSNHLSSLSDPVTDAISFRLTTPPDYLPAGVTSTGYEPCQ